MLTLILAVAVMAWVDWPLALVALAPAPVVSFVVIVFGRMIHDPVRADSEDVLRNQQPGAGEPGWRARDRAYVQEEAEIPPLRAVEPRVHRRKYPPGSAQGMFMPVLQALIGLAFLVVLWAGGARLLSGSISLGNFVMFNTYMGMLVWPMIALGWVVNLMQRGTASLARIDEMMQQKPTIAEPRIARKPVARSGRDRIPRRARAVRRYRQSGRCKPADSGRNHCAIVGHTGSGKSTLVNLIPRIIDPTSGAVLVDGHDVREYSSRAIAASRSASFRRRRSCSA